MLSSPASLERCEQPLTASRGKGTHGIALGASWQFPPLPCTSRCSRLSAAAESSVGAGWGRGERTTRGTPRSHFRPCSGLRRTGGSPPPSPCWRYRSPPHWTGERPTEEPGWPASAVSPPGCSRDHPRSVATSTGNAWVGPQLGLTTPETP